MPFLALNMRFLASVNLTQPIEASSARSEVLFMPGTFFRA